MATKKKPYEKPAVESKKVFISLFDHASGHCPPKNPHCFP